MKLLRNIKNWWWIVVKIKEIPISERPREKLITIGSIHLSNEDLLAIILDTGTKNESAKDLANHILSCLEHITELKNMNYQTLIKIKGIGPSKAAKILALIELSKRLNSKIDTLANIKANNSKAIYEYYKDRIGVEKQEHFYCLYLNNKKRIIQSKLLYIGTINQTLIHPRDIFKEAYILSASAIVCIHNHPSGNVLPSKEDIIMTRNLKQIGELMGISVVDHLIIGSDRYYSFFENGDI